MYDIVCFGELLWDMLPSGKVVGGAPFNISNRVQSLGLRSAVITSVGDDALGHELIEVVKSKGNVTDYIQIHPQLPTSQVIIHVSESGEPHYDIIHPVAWDDILSSEVIIDLIGSSRVFVYSSLALRDPRSRDVLFALLPHARIKVCDINLREGHYDRSTILRMLDHADIIRMNEYELKMACDWVDLAYENFEQAVIMMAEHYQLDSVIATLGSDGAISYKDGQFYRQPVFEVDVIDTVGAGDAFLATYLSKVLSGAGEQEALQYGCVIGALTASKHGGTPRIVQSEIDLFLSRR